MTMGIRNGSILEFGYRYDSWKKFYRAIYMRPVYEEEQRVFDFARPENILVTNLGVNPEVLKGCSLRCARRPSERIRSFVVIISVERMNCLIGA